MYTVTGFVVHKMFCTISYWEIFSTNFVTFFIHTAIQTYLATWLILTVLRPAIERTLLSCKSLKASSYLKHNSNWSKI